MTVQQSAEEVVERLHEAVVESGADAASMTWGEATLRVAPGRAEMVVSGGAAVPIPLRDRSESEEETIA